MQTKFDVGQTVMVPARVVKIFITDKNTYYMVNIKDDDNHCVHTIDLKEETITNAETGR